MTNSLKIIGNKAKKAALEFGLASASRKNSILKTLARLIKTNQSLILKENQKDLKRLSKNNPFYDRLLLNKDRLQEIEDSLLSVVKLPDPIGEIIEKKKQPNGLIVSRIRVPLGVIAVIYESRPNVTIEVSSLGLKTGNALILKGGKEARLTNRIFVLLIQKALVKEGFSKNTVQLFDTTSREQISSLLKLNDYLDVVIPRGSRRLIDFVRQEASVPMIETGAGVCHIYVEKSAELNKATRIIENAKTQRPTVCNALDTLVLDRQIASKFLPQVAERLKKYPVIIKADTQSFKILEKYYPQEFLKKASQKDFGYEFLSLKMSVKTVRDYKEAINFIQKYTSRHSEAILTNNKKIGEKFLQTIDASTVYLNTSTRFTDGFQFGLGAEVGISTQKLHARGPMGLKELTSIKWVVESNWKIRS